MLDCTSREGTLSFYDGTFGNLSSINVTGCHASVRSSALSVNGQTPLTVRHWAIVNCIGVSAIDFSFVKLDYSIANSNFIYNDLTAAVLYVSETTVTVESCVFDGNSKDYNGSSRGWFILIDCVSNQTFPSDRVSSASGNSVISFPVTIEIPGVFPVCYGFETCTLMTRAVTNTPFPKTPIPQTPSNTNSPTFSRSSHFTASLHFAETISLAGTALNCSSPIIRFSPLPAKTRIRWPSSILEQSVEFKTTPAICFSVPFSCSSHPICSRFFPSGVMNPTRCFSPSIFPPSDTIVSPPLTGVLVIPSETPACSASSEIWSATVMFSSDATLTATADGVWIGVAVAVAVAMAAIVITSISLLLVRHGSLRRTDSSERDTEPSILDFPLMTSTSALDRAFEEGTLADALFTNISET
jgi:hypothetical protein